MDLLPRAIWARILVIFCYIIIGVISLYILFSKLFSIAAPFIIALGIGRLLQDPINKLNKRLGIPRRIVGFMLTLVVILFFVFVSVLIINQFISEAQRIFLRLSENGERIVLSVQELLSGITDSFPFIFDRLDPDVAVGAATEAVNNIVSTLTSELADILTGTVRSIPGVILFFTVFIIASFYFSMDYMNMKKGIRKLLPLTAMKGAVKLKDSLRITAVKYVKAYSLIFLITFAELFIGFIVTGVEYALLLAMATALLDLLPVIGTGTVLIPWAAVRFLTGDGSGAVKLLILFAVISVVRELIEPRIVGGCIGMHPLLTLLSMYTGYKLFGVVGILLLPPVIMIVKNTLGGISGKPKDNNSTDIRSSC